MSDFDKALTEVRAAYGVREISDACARVIASMYHEGCFSVGYSFVSTGTIPETVDDLICDLWPDTYARSGDETLMLGALATYALNREDRGAQPGWSRLWL